MKYYLMVFTVGLAVVVYGILHLSNIKTDNQIKIQIINEEQKACEIIHQQNCYIAIVPFSTLDRLGYIDKE